MNTNPESDTVSEAQELLPCPFCGASPKYVAADGLAGSRTRYYCTCSVGPAATGFGTDHRWLARNLWNRRASRAEPTPQPTTPRSSLIKSGALILAEIERLDRAALSAAQAAKEKP